MSTNIYSRVPTNNSNTTNQPPNRSPTPRRFVLSMLFGTLLLAAASIVAMPVWQSLKSHRNKSSKPLLEMPMEATAHLNTLGFQILDNLSEENALISPMSIASAMSMVALGATPASPTQAQLQAVLPATVPTPMVGKTSDESVELQIANAAWLTSKVRPEYQELVQQNLGADVHAAPLTLTAQEVNEWVSQATEGNIEKLLDTIPQPLVALLVNAVYFKAKWTTAFDKTQTRDRPFQLANSNREDEEEEFKVPMMQLRKETFPFAEVSIPNLSGTAKIVELPYGQSSNNSTNAEFSAVFVLPPPSTQPSHLLSTLAQEGHSLWRTWMDALTPTKLDILAVPRFQLSYGVHSLKPSLQSLGITSVFEPNESNPPLTAMTSDEKAYLEDVLHKATVECTEEGTVASAATVAMIMSRSMPPPMPSVVLERGFLFGIRSRKSGGLLFLGRVDRPVSP